MTHPFTVFIVRHGQTALNADGRLRGHADIELDSVGQLEAARLANVFARVPLARIVSSPLRRARHTAAPIALTHDIVVDIDDDLIDRDYGPSTGQLRTVIEAQYGSLDDAPKVEAISRLHDRLMRAFSREVDNPPTSGALMFVGHDATNAALLQSLIGDHASPHSIGQHTGCWNRIERRDGKWHAVNINEVPSDDSSPIEL